MSYTKPTKSTNLYEFTNREQDLIRQAFNSKNFTYISKLPASISPSRVSESYKQTSIANTSLRHNSVPRKSYEFQWMPDEYDLAKMHQRVENEKSRNKQGVISPKNFKNPGNAKKLKYQDLDGNNFSYSEDFFENVSQQATRIRWLKESRFINKEFKSPVKSDYYVSRGKAKEILNCVKSIIEKDWPEIKVSVVYGVSGLVEVKFSGEVNKAALHSYMNVFHIKQEFMLKKDMSQWGAEMGDSIYYTLCPPWIHTRTSDVYSSLFPHSSSISTSRTGKNMPGSEKSTLFNSIY